MSQQEQQQQAENRLLQQKWSSKSRASVESGAAPMTSRSLSTSKSDAVQAVAAGLGVEEAEKASQDLLLVKSVAVG
jgi:hypothetical protein